MPLRALLLMPSGEQPTIPASKPTSSRFRRSQNPTTPRIISPKDLAAAARLSTISQGAYGSRPLVHDSSSLLNDNSDEGKNTDRWSISSKPLPSPPPRTERDSNQTYQTTLTLPSTSGSSSRSGTDHAPSPPLSPSPTSTSSSRRSTGYDAEGSSAQSKSSGMAIEAIEAKHLRASERFMQSNSSTPPTLRLKLPSIPSERDERGRPILKVNTALSRVGSSLKYNRNESYRERDVSPESEGRQSVQPGEQTARKAVSDRIRHLVATTNQSESVASSPMTAQLGFSFLSPLSSPSRAASPTHSRPQSLSPSTNRISATPSTALPPATALPPLSARRFTRRKPTLRRYRIAPAHPPPPPTKGLPPFKFLSDEEMLQLLGEGYIRGMTEGSRVTTGWKQLDATRIGRISRPKGTKGKYIRLISLPPLVVDVPNESIEGTIWGERAKGLQPSIRMELDEETDDGVMDTGANTFVPTIYMTELLASQYDMPVACMMWPPLPTEVVTSALKAHKRPVSEASTTAGAPSHVRHDELIHQPPAKAYQFPIQDLTRVQRTTLQSAKLLVYAVPPQYLGPVPPPELEIVKEEVVAPWANTQFNTASSLAAIVEGNTKPSTPRLSGFPSGALSPRWGPAVEGLWSKSGTDTAKKRVSSASVRSVESSAPNTAKPEGQEATPAGEPDATLAEGQTTTSTWSAGLGSLRSRYYASRGATGPPVTTSQLSTSTSDPANVTSPLSTSSVLSPPSATSAASISGSRSFGSFFSRSTSSPATTTIASTLASTSIVQTSSSSSTTSQQQQQLKVDEFGFVAGAESGSFVFDGDDLVPKDVTLGVSTAIQPKTETVDAVETPSTAQSTGWRGWGARWGRGNQ